MCVCVCVCLSVCVSSVCMLIRVVCDGIHVLSTQAHDYCVIIIIIGLSA